MSIRICADDYFRVDPGRLELSSAAITREVTARNVASDRDGEVDRVADPVRMIDATSSWTNTRRVAQRVAVRLHIGPRSIVTSNPNAVAMTDWSGYEVGRNPIVDTMTEYHGAHLARFRLNVPTDQGFAYGTRFDDIPDRVIWYELPDAAQPGDTAMVTFRTLLTTPGLWREPSTFMFEARAYWVRMQLWAMPDGRA